VIAKNYSPPNLRNSLRDNLSSFFSFFGFFGFFVFAVLLKDVLVRCTLGRNIWMVVPAQDVRSAF